MSSPPVVYGKYQLLERLALGGMAEVFKAKSYGVEGFEKVLVIKRILPALARQSHFVEMFIHEAKLSVTLSHANIAQVFDLGRVEDSYFIAMEFVAGLDLRTVLRVGRHSGSLRSESLAVFLASELAKGLDYAHRRRDSELRPLGIVHRDVSPENVLVSHEGEVKLTDFGIARARELVFQPRALPLGKLAYIAPERAQGGEVDHRADIYSLGAILYEMVAGEPAISGASSEEVLARARAGLVRPLGEAADVPEELSEIVARAMAPVVEDRYASAGDFYEDLIQFLYATGPRVSSQDLAQHVAELMEAGAGEPSLLDSNVVSGLEEIFRDMENGAPTSQRAATPLAIPTSRPPPSRPLGDPGTPRAEWRDVCVLAASFDHPQTLRELVQRYGGQVFPGESIGPERPQLFLFGLGEGAGRDAHEAARCGMRALAKCDQRHKGRVLLHLGRVLLDAEMRPVRDMGLETLRGAALRVLREAEWGAVSVSGAAAKSLRPRFELAPAAGQAPRSVTRELRADEGVGRFVGRRAELRTIGESLALANQGAARVLGIRGDAGMGKTRLLLETGRRLRHTGHEVGVYVATCAPRHRHIPLRGVAAMLRTILGIEEMAGDAEIRRKLSRLRELGLSDTHTGAVARALGLPIDGKRSYGTSMLRAALQRIAQKLAEDVLSVFVWDGAEFMDVASVSVLTRTMTALPRARVLAVLSYRSGEMARPDLLRDATEIELPPLSRSEIQKLLQTQLKVSEVPEALVRDAELRSGGNPMYVEELLWAMRDAGALSVRRDGVSYDAAAARTQLPRTLRGLISSRVGRLSARHRSILQFAVVIGAQFDVELLARAAGQDEATVRAALGLLEERRVVQSLSALLYAFEHELTREVLYESLPIDARPDLHAAVAAAIESMRPGDEIDQVAARLAKHHRAAGNHEQALEYLVRAAGRAEAEHLPEAAIDAYSEAIELIGSARSPDRERILWLQERIGQLALATGRAEAVADRMGAAVEMAETLGRDEYVARFAMMRGRLLGKASRFQEGRQWLQRAQQVARRLGDRGLERDVALAAAEAHSRNGEYNAVLQYARVALPLADEEGDTAALVRALLLVAPAYATLGDGEQALAALRRVRTLVGRTPDRVTDCELSRIRSIVLHQMGDPQGMVEAARQSMDLAREYGMTYEFCMAAHMLGEYHIRAHDDKRAFVALRAGYELASEHGFARQVWLNACVLGYLDAMRFEAGQGRVRMLQAIRYAEQRGYTWDLLGEKYWLARVEQRCGDGEAARRCLRSVMDLAERHGHRRLGEDAEKGLHALDAGQEIPLPR